MGDQFSQLSAPNFTWFGRIVTRSLTSSKSSSSISGSKANSQINTAPTAIMFELQLHFKAT